MEKFRLFLKILISLVFILVLGLLVVKYYSWIFAKTVEGKIVDVQRVTNPSALIGGSRLTSDQLHSYSILIEGQDGKLYSSSAEDRQWQVASKGLCVKALLFRYPPWDLEKAGTFFNARVKELSRCGSGAPLPLEGEKPQAHEEAPGPQPTEGVSGSEGGK